MDDDSTAQNVPVDEGQAEQEANNHMKRRNSDEVDGEKRFRENEEPAAPPETTASPPDQDDPQMQVSSLESDDFSEPVPAEENGPAVQESEAVEDEVPVDLPESAPTLPEDPLSLDLDVRDKLREMGEISVQSVTEATMLRTTEDEAAEPVDEVSLTMKPPPTKEEEADEKKKVTNLRKNIREVIDDTMLDASTLAAQREEQERLNRVQEQQRALRALQRQTDLDKRQSSILSLLHGTLDATEDPSLVPALSASTVRVLDKKTGQVLEEIPDQKSMLEPGEIPNPALANAQLLEAQKLTEKPEKKEVVTIDDSSDDDCIMLSDEEEEPDGDDDPHNSGVHVNDTYNQPDDEGRVLVNFGHSDTEQDVFVAPQIARALKPHQIGGIRFLYDNIIESLDRFDQSTGFGCILAHSMGLGKTLQMVCFCDIFLRQTSARTVLCIMPINTLQNWLAEFNWWLPEDANKSPLKEFGEVRGRNFKIHVLNDSQKTLAARSKVVLNWSRTGGVLLIGYELYRLLCLKKVQKKKGKRAERDPVYAEKEQAAHGELLEEIYEALVKPGPDLVVCDEGHRIKSSHASTSVALKQVRTKRRVVLTGYPLQNNLLEYWCMVDFVRPNYLGTKTEFCNMFEKPIQNGQCIDSTPQDIKLMRYRAHVLHSLLLGFVQRRSHLVLQSTLPSKLEYVMLVRMTSYQRKLYDVFMNEVVRKKAVPNPLKAFAVCCKIWNHPDVLYNFLKKREADLDLELEEEMAMAEAKKVRKEKEQKAKEEAAAKEAAETAKRQTLENGVKVKDENVYQATTAGMNSYAQSAYGGGGAGATTTATYNNSTDPMGGVGGVVGSAYDPMGYGNPTNYYSQYNNHNSYQSATASHLGHSSAGYDNHQYYNNGDQYGPGMQSNNGGGYYDQLNPVSSVQYPQTYAMNPTTTGNSAPNDIPTTVTDVTSQGQLKSEMVKEGELKDEEEIDQKKVGDFKKTATPEKELKSSRDDGIPYDWAVELMKDYVPDLLEHAPKMEIFFCILKESLVIGDRILVFSQSLLTLNLIERYLQRNKVHGKEEYWAKNTNYFRLDGSTTACDRERLINEFNTNENVAIFLVSTRAGSLGINLVGANRVIVFDASWNPCHDTQAVCRVYRYGQKKPCFVYRMVMDNCLEKRIYDRQVNKQGMSDRVVDECNPDAHLSIKEVTNLCWDNDEETEVRDFSDVKDQYPDVVMKKVLENYSTSLSKEPFRHESLLVDRKEKKLSMAEKRLAQRGYELEKQASTKSTYNYTGKVTQYRVFRTADGSLVHRAVGSVQPLDGATTSTGAPTTGSKWIPAEVWRQQGMTTQETTLPADVTIPSNSGDKAGGIVLKAGQKVMILKSSKGVYMQLETGKIIAIRTGPKPQAAMNIPRPRGFGDVNEVIKLDDDDEDEAEANQTKAKTISKQQAVVKEEMPPAKPRPTKETSNCSSSSSSNSNSASDVKPAIGTLNNQNNQQSAGGSQSTSSGYYGQSSTSGYTGAGAYNASSYNRQYEVPVVAPEKSHSTHRDYNSTYSSGYADSRGVGEYQQKSYAGQSSRELPAQGTATAALAASAAASSSSSGASQSYPAGSSGAYGYGSATSERMPSNGQYGGGQHVQQQQQHRSATAAPSNHVVAAAAAPTVVPPPPVYPQSAGYEYSNRYYDTQPKALSSQYNHTPPGSHYATPASAYPPQSAYPNAYHQHHSATAAPPHHHHHQYGQIRPGEYNPNNPPYYMNPFGGTAVQGSAAGTAAPYQTQPYEQQPGMPQTQQLQQQYAEGAVYGAQYGGGQMGKVEAAPSGGESKRKESTSRRKTSESAFHKPTTTEGTAEVKTAATVAAAGAEKEVSSNYYDRASSSYGAFTSPYSPYNYPPSYFYPSGYCAPPPPLPAHTSSKDSKGGSSSTATPESAASSSSSSSKYYDLSRTSSQHYQPPKW